MNQRALAQQLLSMRAQIDAALFLLSGEQAPEPTPEQPECEHRNRQSRTVMGGPTRWICTDCSYEHEDQGGS